MSTLGRRRLRPAGALVIVAVVLALIALAVVAGTGSSSGQLAVGAHDPVGTGGPSGLSPSGGMGHTTMSSQAPDPGAMSSGVPDGAAAELPPPSNPPYDPCPAVDGAVAGDGPSVAAPVTIPAVAADPLPGPAAQFDPQPGDVPATYAGTILRPADTTRYPGARPVVLLFHGIYGDQCQMWWLAQYLAGDGYVTMTVTSPTPAVHDASYGVAIDAARSAMAFLQAPLENPFAPVTDPDDVGLAGWSEGSVVASVVQGLPDMQDVRAIVALDDLRGSFLGDTGAPLTFCSPPVRATVSPRVPALGFASDTACDVEAGDTRPGIKLSGFDRWRHAGIDAVELPLAGYSHEDYEMSGPRLVPLAQLSQAWFDRWLLDQRGALAPLTSCQLDGVAFPGALSSSFRSAAYLPSEGIDSTTWARTLAARCHQEPTEIGTTPIAAS